VLLQRSQIGGGGDLGNHSWVNRVNSTSRQADRVSRVSQNSSTDRRADRVSRVGNMKQKIGGSSWVANTESWVMGN
jgi:hypothetical protein